METLTGTICKVVYTSLENDFKIFEIRRSDRSVIKIKGEFPVLLMGAKVQVHGKYESHHKYGLSFKSDAHSFDFDNSAKSVAIYIMSIAKWVGHERAEALANKFGTQLEEIIEKTPEKLTEVEGVGEKVAASIVEAWEMNRSLKDIKIFLYGLGLSDFRVKKILGIFGIDTEDILKRNPWMLCFHGFGFTTCDFIANKLNKTMKEPDRYKYYILHTLRECNSYGHLYLSPSQILDAFNKYNKSATFIFKTGDMTIEDIAPHIRSLVAEGLILNDNNRIYEITNFFYENESARLLMKLASNREPCNLDGVDIEEYIKQYELSNGPDFHLSEAQREAVRVFVTEKVLVITGGPGTGKTTLTKALVRLMLLNGMQFELLTPTGISAKKLGNTAGHGAYTIHRRLGYKGDMWDYGAMCKYPTDVVIVDETSMVDMEVFYRLVSALYSRTRMIFVGDNDQLPSVGPGSVLKELINSGEIKVIRLEHIFRQAKHSEIIEAAKRIRDGNTDLSLFKNDKFADVWHIRMSDPDKIEETIVNFSQQFKEIAKTRGENAGFQIITPRNEGPCSVDSLNKALQEALNPKSDDKKELTIGKTIIRKGDRVMIKKNNYQLDVFNGDVGKVSFITLDNVVVDVEDFFDKSRRVEIPIKIADEMLRLAYTISIHRSQGLEYPFILIPFIKAHGTMLLQRNLLYTAITRAKKKVIVIGQSSAIESAIANDKMQKRNTLFSDRLKIWKAGKGMTLSQIFANSPESMEHSRIKALLLSEEKG